MAESSFTGFPFAIESLLQTVDKHRVNDPVIRAHSTERLSCSTFNPLKAHHGVLVISRGAPPKGSGRKGNPGQTNSTRS